MSITLPEALMRCIAHQEIGYHDMQIIFSKIINNTVSPTMIAAFTIALRVKKESINEITAATQIMRKFAIKVPISKKIKNLLDIAGTGGDQANTFNISTATMFVAAAAGVYIAKHGGYGISSTSGSADVLKAFGINIHLPPDKITQSICQSGIGFMLGQEYHIGMKHVAKIRKEMGVCTIFNILGPLINPANAPNILIGVFDIHLVNIVAHVLHKLGTKRAIVVCGCDNLDEVTLDGETIISELLDNKIHQYKIHPKNFGIKTSSSNILRVSNVLESKEKIIEALTGVPGPAYDIVTLNAGVALYIANKAISIKDGVHKARTIINSGAALDKIKQFTNITNKLACITAIHK